MWLMYFDTANAKDVKIGGAGRAAPARLLYLFPLLPLVPPHRGKTVKKWGPQWVTCRNFWSVIPVISCK